ncbi:MAG: hypothetical protein ABI670_05120 [Chloroflexota bacterium]
MATEPVAVEETEEIAEVATRPRPRGNPIDNVGPTCMFWAMVAGLGLLMGIMLIWGIANLDKI